MLIYPINHSILMGSVVTFRSAYGSIVYISMVLLLIFFAALILLLPSIDLILIPKFCLRVMDA